MMTLSSIIIIELIDGVISKLHVLRYDPFVFRTPPHFMWTWKVRINSMMNGQQMVPRHTIGAFHGV